MAGPKPTTVELTPEERVEVERLVRAHGTAQQVALRAQIILLAGASVSTVEISARVGLSRKAVRLWRDRWASGESAGAGAEQRGPLGRCATAGGSSAHWGGAGLRDQGAGVCSARPVGAPLSQWTAREGAAEITGRGIVATIAPRHAARLLQRGSSPAFGPLLADSCSGGGRRGKSRGDLHPLPHGPRVGPARGAGAEHR